jgi:hypothetical protein
LQTEIGITPILEKEPEKTLLSHEEISTTI